MRTLYMSVGILLGIYSGGALAFLMVSNSGCAQEAAPWAMMYLLIPLGGGGGAVGGLLASKLHGYMYSEPQLSIARWRRIFIPCAFACTVPLLIFLVFHTPINYNIPPSDAFILMDFPRRKALMEQMPPAIDFTVWNSPAFSEEWEGQASKGYANFKTPPPNLLPSLDNVPHGGDKDFKAYRHVEGNWYLFFFYKPP